MASASQEPQENLVRLRSPAVPSLALVLSTFRQSLTFRGRLMSFYGAAITQTRLLDMGSLQRAIFSSALAPRILCNGYHWMDAVPLTAKPFVPQFPRTHSTFTCSASQTAHKPKSCACWPLCMRTRQEGATASNENMGLIRLCSRRGVNWMFPTTHRLVPEGPRNRSAFRR
jgi:hypothetical protein